MVMIFLYQQFFEFDSQQGAWRASWGQVSEYRRYAATVNDIWLFQYSLSGVFCWTSLQITSIQSALGQAGGSEGRPGQHGLRAVQTKAKKNQQPGKML